MIEPDRRGWQDKLTQKYRCTEERDISKQARITDIIPLDKNNDPPPEGIAILDDESDSDDSLLEPVTY